jgi:3-methyladenine DNA glycosylase AlkD
MPYHGVPAPRLRQICRELFDDVAFANASAWREEAQFLWRNALFREERYAAIFLTGCECSRRFQTPAAVKMYEEFIVTGAWWDYVDTIASSRLGPILRDHPTSMRRRMLTWSKCNDLWKRRSSILCQLALKENSDVQLLYACIEPSLESREFFLQKAIGWALRQYARTDPAEIVRYVRTNRSKLSALSRREALKHL